MRPFLQNENGLAKQANCITYRTMLASTNPLQGDVRTVYIKCLVV
jgi:hypothetical protein